MTSEAASCFGKYYVPGALDCRDCGVRDKCKANVLKLHLDAAPRKVSEEEKLIDRIQKKLAVDWPPKEDDNADSE